MTTINRKIKRGTLDHENNPLVIKYNNIYRIGKGLVFKVIQLYGDSNRSHNICSYISMYQKSHKTSGTKFEEIIREYDNLI